MGRVKPGPNPLTAFLDPLTQSAKFFLTHCPVHDLSQSGLPARGSRMTQLVSTWSDPTSYLSHILTKQKLQKRTRRKKKGLVNGPEPLTIVLESDHL